MAIGSDAGPALGLLVSPLAQATVLLAAAVVVVPIAKRLGFGAVLGYLAAGLLIGPWGLGLIEGVQAILHFAELGVVLLLFVIGLELQPSRLWSLRKPVFGLGSAQVGLTGVIVAGASLMLGLPWPVAVVLGLALSLSSTAFALQTLAEKRQLTTRHGRSAFAILLFQDVMVVPILALVPLLGAHGAHEGGGGVGYGALKALAMVGVVVGLGHVVVGPVLRTVAATRTREVFTATALLIVVGTASLMNVAGLSMALGAFLAGVLLADSDYRHALEADIEPFKGLLLGLFFMAVGMSLNLGILAESTGVVVLLVLALVGLKFGVICAMGWVNGYEWGSSTRLAAVLSQGGEFAFVIFGVATASEVVDPRLADLMIVAVTLSMATTPFLYLGIEWALSAQREGDGRAQDTPAGEDNQVIIAGFGRFGQIVGRVLRARRIPFTALDANPEQVDFVRTFGNKVYYGDASRIDLLHAAKASEAELFVLCIDDVGASLRTAEVVTRNFPNLKVYARARNRKHAYQLMDLGIKIIERETFESSLEMARLVLEGLGNSDYKAASIVQRFRAHDLRRLQISHDSHTNAERMAYLARESAKELEEMFDQDEAEDSTETD